MRLSTNFMLEEFLESQAAARHGIDMTPPQYVIDNLRHLAVFVLQPLREDAGRPIVITSGYRPPELNELIGGSRTSAHMEGRAADFKIFGKGSATWESPYATIQRIERLGLVFDQAINEFGQWTHVGIAEEPREQILTAVRENNITRYIVGLHDVEEIQHA